MADRPRYRVAYELSGKTLADLLNLHPGLQVINAVWNVEHESVVLYCIGNEEAFKEHECFCIPEGADYLRIHLNHPIQRDGGVS